jgi:hypothetical protein
VTKKSTGPKPGVETAPKTDKGVAISSLDTLQHFQYQGKVYSKRKVTPAGVKALSQKGDKLITLSPDTLVTPIK